MADTSRIGGGTTPYEAQLEMKRRALRRALKHEFIRQKYHPQLSAGPGAGRMIFDSGIHRWQAMMNTHFDWFKPNWRNGLGAAAILVPFCLIAPTIIAISMNNEENRYKRGEVAYDAEERKAKVLATLM